MKYISVVISLALCACASELHTSSSLDVAATKTETAHVETHAAAIEHVEDHSAEREAENVVTTHSGGAVELDEVRTLPNGTKVERHYRRAAVTTKVDSRKHENVQKAISADATSLLDAHEDTAAKTDEHLAKQDELSRKRKPSFGFLAGLMPWLLGLGAVLVLVALSAVTKTNPITLAGKVVLWAVAKLRGQPSAG